MDGNIETVRNSALQLMEDTARSTLAKLPRVSAENAVSFVHGDLFNMDVSKVTHVYAASLCFNDSMLRRVARKLAAEAQQLEVVASLRRFPLGILGFEYAGSIQAEMSWTKSRGSGANVYLYRRRADKGLLQPAQ